MTDRYRIVCILILTTLASCSQTSPRENVAVKHAFGERQLQQMFDDRPDMREAIAASHPVIVFACEGFNGKRVGMRIYWNANSPTDGRGGGYSPPYESYPGYISISGGTETTAIDKWAYLVYGLYVAENNPEYEHIEEQALAGKMNADDYVNRYVALEFKAAEKAQQYFRKNPLPFGQHGRDQFYRWLTYDLETLEKYKKSSSIPGVPGFAPNTKLLKEHFEKSIVPYVEMLRNSKP